MVSNRMKGGWLTAGCLCLGLSAAHAQETSDSVLFQLQNMSAYEAATALQAGLNEEFSAGALQGMSSREVPNIVSVIGSEEIQQSGARDLMDVLRMVPGFDFGTDVESAVGLVVRGNWAYEGKVLIMIDGIEMNELAFQTVNLGQHFPVNLIERVEIIRGPGSAIYGGTAEYGVINLITKGKDAEDALVATTTYGHLGDSYGRQNASIRLNKQIKNVQLDFSAALGKGYRSDQVHTDFYGDVYPMNSRAGSTASQFLNFGIRQGGFQLRALYDDYQWGDPYYGLRNRQLAISTGYELKVNDKLQLKPTVSFTNQLPWEYEKQFSESEEDWYFYKIQARRFQGGLQANYRAHRKLRITSGIEASKVVATDMYYDPASDENNFGDAEQLDFSTLAAFGQALWKTRFANLTGGLRYEYRNDVGGAVVPRFAVTRHMNRFHAKLLYSHAYRMPGIENMNLAVGDMKPEKARVMEAEVGYQFTPDMLFSVNAFHTQVNDIIIFNKAEGEEYYYNAEVTGSKGVEAGWQLKRPRWNAQLAYAYYRALEDNTVLDYAVEGNDEVYLAVPAHKLSLNTTYLFSDNISLNVSGIVSSERFAYTGFAADEESMLMEKLGGYAMLNLNFLYRNLFPGFHLSAGVYDLFDEGYQIAQPYKSEYAPLPTSGRELLVKFQYQLSL